MTPHPAARHCQAFVDALARLPTHGGVVGMMSPHRGDGRSTLAAGLALTLAHEGGGRVLLLELDVERPSQTDRFGICRDPGVCGHLGAPGHLGAVSTMITPRLWLAPAGSGGLRASMGPLSGVTDSGLLDHCRGSYTWTVVDLPPILDTPGVAAVAALCDACLLVGRYRSTRVDAMARAAALLPAPPLGCVMTADASPVPAWVSRFLRSGREDPPGRC